jgi:hypothetical protein
MATVITHNTHIRKLSHKAQNPLTVYDHQSINQATNQNFIMYVCVYNFIINAGYIEVIIYIILKRNSFNSTVNTQ